MVFIVGVTIATLTGDNGILTKATEVKDKTEEGEEVEKVKLSAVGALAKDNGGEIKEGYLEEELSSQFGEKGTDYEESHFNGVCADHDRAAGRLR